MHMNSVEQHDFIWLERKRSDLNIFYPFWFRPSRYWTWFVALPLKRTRLLLIYIPIWNKSRPTQRPLFQPLEALCPLLSLALSFKKATGLDQSPFPRQILRTFSWQCSCESFWLKQGENLVYEHMHLVIKWHATEEPYCLLHFSCQIITLDDFKTLRQSGIA